MSIDLQLLHDEVRALRSELDRLTQLQEIRDVLRRYARGIDRHDIELMQSAFWPDAQVNYGFYSGERDAFIAWGNEGHENLTVRHEHHITNQTVDVTGDDAHVESYVIFFLREKDEQHTLIGGARYIDRMERRNGEWRVSMREFLPDIMVRANSVFAGYFAEMQLPPSGEGRWDREDLSYKRPLDRRPGPPTGQDITKFDPLTPFA